MNFDFYGGIGMENNLKSQARSDENFLLDTQKKVGFENFAEYNNFQDFCTKREISGQPAIKYLLDELERRKK